MHSNSPPRSYIKIARALTGYWPTYPSSLLLAPGDVGKSVDGMFVKEGQLSQYPGFDQDDHRCHTQDEKSPSIVWTTQRVKLEVPSAAINTGVGKTRVSMKFEAANEAVIICNGSSFQSFEDLRKVKNLLRLLAKRNQWEPDNILVIQVLTVASGLVLFSTAKDQMAELEGSSPFAAAATEPASLLKEIAPSAEIVSSAGSKYSAGFAAALPPGGTPLFMAVKFKRKMPWSQEGVEIEYVKGASLEFEEATFGEE